MRVPFNDLRRQYSTMGDILREALQRVAMSGWYIMGPEHDAFEREFADYCGCSHAIAVANGTDALELALRCAGCGPGDEVITVANAGGYTTTATVLVGATPVFADIDPDTLTLSPASVADALSDRTKAVVITHLAGRLGDVDGVRAALGGRSVALIEDCAQAHGAHSDRGCAGSLADLATFSFYPTKNLGALGDAGAVTCSNDDHAERLRALRQYGWQGRYRAAVPLGRNSRMDEIQAAVLRAKLPLLDDGNEMRRRVTTWYCEAANGTGLTLPHQASPSYVGHLCLALHDERDALRERLAARGVDTALHYPYLDFEQPALERIPWRAVDLTVTKRMAHRVFSLPCFPELTSAEVEQVCDAIAECA